MNKTSFGCDVQISTTANEAFDAITKSIDKWWGKVSNPIEKEGDTFKISFGPRSFWEFEVIKLTPNKSMQWQCITSNQNHNIDGMDEEWLGTIMKWSIEEEHDGGILLKFEHDGLLPHFACYSVCSSAWSNFVTVSLKNYLETGAGNPES